MSEIFREIAGLLLPLAFLALVLASAGCGSLLPSVKQTTRSPWETFDEAKNAFDKIILYKTSTEELQRLGFSPFSTPNIKIITYLDIIQRFMANPSIKKEDLDNGLQTCIDAKSNCSAYEVQPKFIASQRYGSVLLDLFNFSRKTHQSGWEFEALIVIVHDTVVYKLWGGKPAIDESKETKNPLGPLQDASDLLFDATRKTM
ncbi:MAG: hypothetical protein FD156_375 [Nitrospirae bacterium]|nr:MAG: hypothetical protein FD156_375 [Nitrospirota bacterium]